MIYLSGKVVADLPVMVTPRHGHRLSASRTWAADNGRYGKSYDYSDEKYLAWLGKMPVESCLFATAPDVWGDAAATLELSIPMLAPIRGLGYRVALVAQDGLELLPIPWDDFDILFIGGSDPWRHSDGLRHLAAEAKRRGKWVHMGRVNSLRRMRYAESIGCDSADGTILKHDPSRPVHEWGPTVRANPSLWRPSA